MPRHSQCRGSFLIRIHMKYRNFKEVKLSEVGLGTWQLGSADWGNINKEDAFSILQAYVDGGGNFY